ncbi:4Fe-4S dicluster domain-containing protein [Rhodocyclus tenuis]|uniref:4Fe-4S dicluster domain-containing protein n=1 Tax=Rhodocyclus gracilis TaxID=2929842 RepID=UPI00129889FF|nr:4Fe-4S dicluster domain-containing protein [Rhodocyclus gracilis]MRD72401.1 4Fe-4S dicluster domain-containing protein [Rhodocyclus gracilis]
MALAIVDSCVNCWACLPVCPNQAIQAAAPPDLPHFSIDAMACSECLGDYARPQCAEICPVEGAIVDELGDALNPPGSLLGLSPAQWQDVQQRRVQQGNPQQDTTQRANTSAARGETP